MKPTHLLLSFALVFISGFSRGASPTPPPDQKWGDWTYHVLIQSDHCTIVSVEATADVIQVEFTGRWILSSALDSQKAEKSHLTVKRAQTVKPADWEAFIQRFTEVKGKEVTLLISGKDGVVIKDRIPAFRFPEDEFQLALPGQSFRGPIGYQF